MTYASSPVPDSPTVENVFLKMLPISAAMLVGFLTMGISMPVLPLHLHYTLDMSPVVVGFAIGFQFAAALLSRAWAGGLADTRGSKRAMVMGFMSASAAGVAYLASLAFIGTPVVSLGVLMLGRLLLGCGESLVMTGALSWGIALVGARNSGKVMAWVGAAVYGAFAAGAPLGTFVYGRYDFIGIAFATIIIPLLALGFIVPVAPNVVKPSHRVPFYKVLGTVWVPGLGMGLSCVGLGVISTFIALLFAGRNWGSASLAFTAFGVAFVLARIFFSHLPDQGGAKVALVCVLVEVAGLLLIWQAGSAMIAYAGAALTGFGYSLAFPGFGVEAVRRAPPQSRGAAMGAFVAFFDIGIGLTGPTAGAIAGVAGLNAVYLAGACAVSLSALVAAYLIVSKPA
ncbi:arabinose transporter [Bradyrhizobium sp. dw_411]|uniref:arabinose transporter n=1 Tax=Bradyrhizobium sp. dw_411 TaxID=2720082 RepID=UPI001BD19F73|nr:arabinose transporter [Bradyrhizobium sp. dw_411]